MTITHGYNILRILYVYLQPQWHNGLAKLSNSVKKTQNKGYYEAQSHRVRYQSKVRMRLLLVINSNWHPISYGFEVIGLLFKFWTLCVFDPPPLWEGLGTTYHVHLWFIGKRILDFLLVLIELFSLSVTDGWSATGENISKIGDFAPTQSVWPKISGRRGRPHQSFLHG